MSMRCSSSSTAAQGSRSSGEALIFRRPRTVEPSRQRDIGMVEHGAGVEDHLEQEHRQGRSAKRHHHHDLPQHGERDLDGVKPHRRGHVDVAIGVMHLVQAPEQRNFVRGQMLHPDGKVEHQERHHHLDPFRPGDLVQEAEMMRLRIERGGDGRDGHGKHGHEPEQKGAGHADADIGEPAPALRDDEPALGPAELDQRHQHEDGCENSKPDEAVALADETVHAAMLAGKGAPVSSSACPRATGRPRRGPRVEARRP